MRRRLRFLCLGCGKVEIVELKQATVLGGIVRCYFPPAGWALLYPPKDFPVRSGICPDCIGKVIEEETLK